MQNPPPGTPTSRYVRGVEIIDSDLDCLRSPRCCINGTVLNAYASLVPDQDKSLTRAGCIILSSLVPFFVEGKNNSGFNLEKYIASVTTQYRLLACRLWAFPLCGGDPAHWVLGWVNWSARELGWFDSLGNWPQWAKQDLCQAAAGLEHWLKYQVIPDLRSWQSRFQGWRSQCLAPPQNQRQKDDWSCGLFVMMAMSELPSLDFSNIGPDRLDNMRSQALEVLLGVRLCKQSRMSRKTRREQESRPSSNDARSHPISRAMEDPDIENIQQILFNAKRLVIFCGPGVCLPPGFPGSSPEDPLGLLRPVVWQDPAQSFSVLHAWRKQFNSSSVDNKFYQALHALDRNGGLLRVYTQNYDCMEKTVAKLSFGVPESGAIDERGYPRCIPLLGRLDQTICTNCQYASRICFEDLATLEQLPSCVSCAATTCGGHTGICRPNIVVSNQSHPDQGVLDQVLLKDAEVVDVVLAVGLQFTPQQNLYRSLEAFSLAALSRAPNTSASSILIDPTVPGYKRLDIPHLFQVSLQSDVQDLFTGVVKIAHQSAKDDPNSNLILITPRHFQSLPHSLKSSSSQDEGPLLLRCPRWRLH